MAKEKKPEITELVEVSEEGLAPIDDVLGFLDKQAEKDYEPGFVKIELGHQTATFASAGFGSDDEFSAIILSAPTVRALWPFGGDEDKETMEEWTGGLPICSSRDEDARQGKGALTKPVDGDTPDAAKHLMQAVMQADFMCKDKSTDGCPWSNFGSIPGQRSQACKKCVRLLLYNPATDVSGILTVPPSSLKVWKNYKAGLTGQHYSRVLTRFSLNQQQQGQIKWSVLDFKAMSEVTPEMIGGLRKLVFYQGSHISQAQALVSEFLRLDLDKDIDYPDSGNGKGDDF